MISKTTKQFRRMFARLPIDVRHQVRKAYNLFKANPKHPSLRFKRVHSTEPIYSVRININYRAVGVAEKGEIIWFWVGSHAEYDRLLDRF